MPKSRSAAALVSSCALFAALSTSATPIACQARDKQQQGNSAKNAVSVSHKKEGKREFVAGKIRIEHGPDRVWPILSNPFEFEHSISPKFKTTDVLVDRPELSVMTCQMEPGFPLPSIKYTVESQYDFRKRITFRSKAGDLKDFRGHWELEPTDNGKASLVTYSMYLEPGIPVPQWMVRQGIRMELPRTLEALRARVDDIYAGRGVPPVKRSLTSTGELTVAAEIEPGEQLSAATAQKSKFAAEPRGQLN